ncbi:flagellar protein FhlB [Aliidiomarina iranensis]|uniref:Flagellar protein FhlB n=1 Tax=Aliidiomarina iranensis TaxID=1434071 RepID=A0A432W1X6_9GAMM|nr:EscU/YscU/HrcU family type III secretion system export apparatus switch protein [Aliidiomarina iranensis]RUO23217.1 flagellar protein FhlB [Aliidiomarina iranensis]
MSEKDWDKRRSAVALGYGHNKQPEIIAQGYGEFAERIIQEAEKHDIFVHDAPELVSLLMHLNPDDYLPDALKEVLVELLIWLQEVADNQSK